MSRLRFRMAAGVALGLIALSAVFAVLMTWAVQLSTDAAVRERVMLARHTAASVDDLLRVARHQMEALASQVLWEADGTRPAAVQPLLPTLQHVTGTFDNLGLVDRRGAIVWSLAGRDDGPGWQTIAARALESGSSTFGQAEGPQEHPPIALLAMPLRRDDGRVAGALVGTLHLAHMGIEIVPLPRGGAESRIEIEIVDTEGRILAASGAEERRWTAEDHLTLLGHALRGGYEATAVHGEAPGHVVAYAPFQLIAGGVFVEEQDDVALAVPYNLKRIGLFVGSSALLLFSLGAYWHASRLTGPLEQLAAAAQAMAQGVFDQPIRWRSRDELGFLARRFEELRLQVKSSLEEREQWERELERQVAERTHEVRLLLGKVISAQEEERRRVARELHDGAAQDLAALLVVMDGVRERHPEKALAEDALFAKARDEARRTLQEIRRLILDLRPAALDDLGLIPALRWYAESRLAPIGVPFTLTVSGQERRFDPFLETALFRIGQEAITNVVKHADARQVSIMLDFGPDTLTIAVEDDGNGFDPVLAADRREGAGLDGMRERATLAGGTLEIRSSPGKGTRVAAAIPALVAA